MDEKRLRELAEAVRADLAELIPDDERRRRVEGEIEDALELPEGEGLRPLLKILGARKETRDWIAAREAQTDLDRMAPGLLGQATAPALGLHWVCPKCDYDKFLESPNEDPGFCPNDRTRLVPAED